MQAIRLHHALAERMSCSGLVYGHLDRKGIQWIDVLLPGSVIKQLKLHLACASCLKAKGFRASRT